MVKVKEDMTGWIMSEHGVPESRWTVIRGQMTMFLQMVSVTLCGYANVAVKITQ